jgi:hypothetical protein
LVMCKHMWHFLVISKNVSKYGQNNTRGTLEVDQTNYQ